jgi:hypothetical protein
LEGCSRINNGGLGLDPTTWATVWFKGGFRAGMLTLGYLGRDYRRGTFVVIAVAERPSAC